MIKPIVTEKAVMMIEKDNVLTFSTDMPESKESVKKYVEEVLDVKVEKIRTLIRNNKKYAYVKLNKNNLAIDVAIKLGLM